MTTTSQCIIELTEGSGGECAHCRHRKPCLGGPATHKGVFYFPHFDYARAFANHNGMDLSPPRLVYYTRGWAIQREISGPYYGPNGWE